MLPLLPLPVLVVVAVLLLPLVLMIVAAAAATAGSSRSCAAADLLLPQLLSALACACPCGLLAVPTRAQQRAPSHLPLPRGPPAQHSVRPHINPVSAAAHRPPIPSHSTCNCSMEAFLPCTPFRLAAKMGARCMLGPLGLAPGALLLSKRGRSWCAPF